MHLPFRPEQAAPASRISEFIFPGDPRQQMPLILPMLSHLSRTGDSRWLTCIGAGFLAKRDCAESQLDWRRLLQVLPSSRCDVIEIACRALSAGKSHTVICILSSNPTLQQLALLEKSAQMGEGRCILMRCR